MSLFFFIINEFELPTFMYTLSAFTCGPNMWYQNKTQADDPGFWMLGLTNPAVSFGLRGYDVSIYMYQPFPESKYK